jgi:hypothetical protein
MAVSFMSILIVGLVIVLGLALIFFWPRKD